MGDKKLTDCVAGVAKLIKVVMANSYHVLTYVRMRGICYQHVSMVTKEGWQGM